MARFFVERKTFRLKKKNLISINNFISRFSALNLRDLRDLRDLREKFLCVFFPQISQIPQILRRI
jgi:hypothetical protein